jgi:hypothetical protein
MRATLKNVAGRRRYINLVVGGQSQICDETLNHVSCPRSQPAHRSIRQNEQRLSFGQALACSESEVVAAVVS